MTASRGSIAKQVALQVGRHWTYLESSVIDEGVLDFTVDGLTFRLLVLDEAENIEGVHITMRSRDDEATEEAIQQGD